MPDMNWSNTEKKLARHLFELALQRKFAALMTEFRTRAAQASEPEDLWNIERFLRDARREIDERFDYRYSRLIVLFGCLLGEGLIEEQELAGLAAGKIAEIRHIASFRQKSCPPVAD